MTLKKLSGFEKSQRKSTGKKRITKKLGNILLLEN